MKPDIKSFKDKFNQEVLFRYLSFAFFTAYFYYIYISYCLKAKSIVHLTLESSKYVY